MEILVVDVRENMTECEDKFDSGYALNELKKQLLEFATLSFLNETKQLAVFDASSCSWILLPPYSLVKAQQNLSHWSAEHNPEPDLERVGRSLAKARAFIASAAGAGYSSVTVFSSALLTADFTVDGALAQLLHSLEAAHVHVTFVALVSASASTQDVILGLQVLKNKLGELGCGVSVTRSTSASIAKLFSGVGRAVQHGCLAFAASGLSVSVDVSGYLNHLPRITTIEFCKCHGLHPASIPRVIEGKSYCARSRKRLEAADLLKGYAFGNLEIVMNPKANLPALPADPIGCIEFEVLRKVSLSNFNIGFLFGTPFLIQPSTDPELSSQERDLHGRMLRSLCAELSAKDEALLLSSLSTPTELSGSVRDPEPPFGRTLRHLLLLSDGECAVALEVATREHIRYCEDSSSAEPLPDQLKLVLEEALASLGPSVEYSPLEHSGNFHERVENILAHAVDSEDLPLMLASAEKESQGAKKGPRKLVLNELKKKS